MSEFTLTMRTDNAAFEDGPGLEITRILRKLADQIDRMGISQYDDGRYLLVDVNGNPVGKAQFTRGVTLTHTPTRRKGRR